MRYVLADSLYCLRKVEKHNQKIEEQQQHSNTATAATKDRNQKMRAL